MPRKPGKVKPDPELAKARERIREAEKAQAPVVREPVAMDKASYELLATLVERGLGKKPAVLAQALAIGLQALANTTPGGERTTAATWADEDRPRGAQVVDLFAPRGDVAASERGTALAASVLGHGTPFVPAPDAGDTVETETQRLKRLAEGGETIEGETVP
jgi:hypothetical protein